MKNFVLVLNAGSSSLKFAAFDQSDPPKPVFRGSFQRLKAAPRFVVYDSVGRLLSQHDWPLDWQLCYGDALAFLFSWLQASSFSSWSIVAAGHRVVHGGVNFTEPCRLNAERMQEIESLIPLAPLHQPHNIEAIRGFAEQFPWIPQYACFDTSFHRTQPSVAQRFALPRKLSAEGIRRYGFHGLSYEFIVSQLSQLDPAAAQQRIIVAHLGNGASLCAINQCKSVATTMSFTPLDGLPMGTRCGSIDPGVLIYLMKHYGMDINSVERLLTEESGLLGVSECSSDMQTLLSLEANDHRAREAIDLFVYCVAREIGALASVLGGLDSLVLTGGIGENAVAVRQRICLASEWCGIKLDAIANESNAGLISLPESRVQVHVMKTNEELMIAQHVLRLLRSENPNVRRESFAT